jgi:ribosome maturation factor RimP
VAGEEVVMRGDSRHAPSRARRADARDATGGAPARERQAAPAPDPDELARLLEPVIHASGMDLETVRVSPAGRRRLLRLVVDADGGVGLDQIAEVSRELSARLDASGAMGEVPYTLEVSSPGVDRPLTQPRHWRRAQGRLVSVSLAPADGNASSSQTAGARRTPTIEGRVLVAGETAVTLEVDGERLELDYAELGPGRVQVEFGRAADAPAAEGASQVADRARSGNGGSRDGH